MTDIDYFYKLKEKIKLAHVSLAQGDHIKAISIINDVLVTYEPALHKLDELLDLCTMTEQDIPDYLGRDINDLD